MLIAWNNQAQRTFASVQGLTITTIGEQNDPITESGVEFRQGKEHSVAIRGAGNDSQGHIRPFQLFAQRSAGFQENLRNWHSFIHYLSTMLIGDGYCLSLKSRDVDDTEIQMIRYLATDAQRYGFRPLGKNTQGRQQAQNQ
jgi:hypothetical protein